MFDVENNMEREMDWISPFNSNPSTMAIIPEQS